MPLKTSTDELPALNLTPMIDVVFNLLLFFMVSTQFMEEEQSGERNIDVGLKVPEVAAAGTTPPQPARWVVNIHRDGRITANDQTISLADLTARLTQARQTLPKVSVMVRGDGGASFQHIAGVLQAVRKAGVSELGISVRMAEAAGHVNR